jgi:HEAT repeat protein
MHLFPLLLLVGLSAETPAGAGAPDVELTNLRDLLHDRHDPRGQSQAALLLVQSNDPAAAKIIRHGLRQPDNEEMFLALTAAIRLRQDKRFFDDLIACLMSNKPRLRQVVAETLAVLPEPTLVGRLETIIKDAKVDIRVRQTAVWALGRCGLRAAVGVLVASLADENEDLRRIASGALTELTGQNLGADVARWRAWWERHKDMTREQWLMMRLAFQTSRAVRLENDLARARAQVLRLHQQVYLRLPVADRFAHLQGVLEQDDPAVRVLAVVWGLELLPSAAGTERYKQLAKMLLKLTHDKAPEVQRAAVLGLGRLKDTAAIERLQELLQSGSSLVRAAAVRALAQQASGSAAAARTLQKVVIPALQKSLEDKSLEVVVESAEALGMLGAPEAGPVLTGLLRHPSGHVRQTAAQALERMADASLIDGLLKGLDDPNETVRFSLVGALGKAADGKGLSDEQRKRLLERLEGLLKGDDDPGVRSRAATVLGEQGGPAYLETLWRVVLAGAEGRAQEKAWDAFVEIIARSGQVKLLEQWDKAIGDAKQPSRRVQLLARVYARWDQRPELKAPATRALEGLVQAQIDQGKWSSAAPLVQNLLARNADGGESARTRCLRWLLEIGELALKEGNRSETLRIVQDARAYLSRGEKLADEFDKLEKQAKKE